MKKSTHTPEYALLRAELKAARENAQLSQRVLAERLGVPRSWIAKVEAGERRIDFVELCWLATACRTDPAELVSLIARKVGAVRNRHRIKKGRSA